MLVKSVLAMPIGAARMCAQARKVGRGGVLVAAMLTVTACGGGGDGGTGSSSAASSESSQSSNFSSLHSSTSSSLSSSVVSSASSNSSLSSALSSSVATSSSVSSANSSSPSSSSAAFSSVPPSSVSSSSSSSTSSIPDVVEISGSVSYDYVPVSKAQGLDYDATVARAVRLARVNLIDQSGNLVASSQTDTAGNYTLEVAPNTSVKVQVEAYSFADEAQNWEIRVEDNTSSNALYVLEGKLLDSGTANSVRNLHAASGWSGSRYAQPRAAAPFAIMDTAYQSVQKLAGADPNLTLPTSVFRWSVNNTVASGSYADGDIGTSFFDGTAVYVLGQADLDTDEYDAHVIAHEWAHFVELYVGGRADSIGGSHADTDKLDMRVAYSEGFANALAGYVLADPEYRDTLGSGQRVSAGFDVSRKNVSMPGWYSESSVQSIFYHLAESGAFEQIYGVLTDNLYTSIPAFTSIFSFADIMAARYPSAFDVLDELMDEQRIDSRDQYGAGETNNGDTNGILPIYIDLGTDGSEVTVCSSQQNGTQNKLGVNKFLKTTVFSSGSYQLAAQNNGARITATDPDFEVYGGGRRWAGFSEIVDSEVVDLNLQSGTTYVISVNDYNSHPDAQSAGYQPACFDISLTPL